MRSPTTVAMWTEERTWSAQLIAWALLCCLCGCQQSELPPETQSPAPHAVQPSEAPKAAPSKPVARVQRGLEQVARPATGKPVTAQGVLEAMVKAYKSAATYADTGEVRMTGQMNDQAINGKDFFLVAFQRPNKIRMQAYKGMVVVDGKKLWAYIDDVPNQVLVQDAKAELKLDWLLRDQGLAVAMSNGFTQPFSWVPIQAILLLADDPLKTLLHDAEKPELLEPGKIGTHACHRVQARRSDGKVVFWVDQSTSVLRRFEYPSEGINQTIAGGQIRDFSLVAEFVDAQLGGKVDPNAFKFQLPDGAEQVPLFLSPDVALLGKPAGPFRFVSLDGTPITRDSLAGKVAVLDIWATWCGPCRASLPMMEKVYQKYKDNPKVAFVAVSVDQPKTEDKQLTQTFNELKVNLPIARDPGQHAGKILAVANIPTTLLLDPKGTVQDCDVGLQARLDIDLPAKLEKLLSGDQIFEAKLAKFKEQQKQYEAWLQAQVDSDSYWGPLSVGMEIPKAETAAQSQPQSLRIRRLWSVPELKKPGNIFVLPQAGKEPRVLVLDEGKSVAELSAEGKITQRHNLALPPGGMVAFLRSAAAKDGRRWFVGGASGLQQVHLFDDKLQHLLDYPADAVGNPHAGIADAQLGDLDGDGTPELCVGYWGIVGVQGASLDGKRLWANRSLATVLRLAILDPDAKGRRGLLCTNQRGTLALLDSKGESQAEISVADHPVHWIVAAELTGDDTLELCGLSPTPEGTVNAVGFNLKGELLWIYPLPRGVHEHPIEPVCAAQLLPGDSGQWLMAGADGSIHLLAADGKAIDKFNYGAALTGLAGLNWGQRHVLLVSTPDGLDAWEVEPPK